MGQSSLLGIDRPPTDAPARDTGALGPSDSSDSGSDMMGIEDLDVDDPAAPLDTALDEDAEHPMTSRDTLAGGPSDAAGTGERRSAGADPGREAADISVDHIVGPRGEDLGDEDIDEDEDPDLGFIDDAAVEDPLSNELPEDGGPDLLETDADTEPGASGASRASGESGASSTSSAPQPGHPNPEPDLPAVPGVPDDDDADTEDDADAHKPGRD